MNSFMRLTLKGVYFSTKRESAITRDRSKLRSRRPRAASKTLQSDSENTVHILVEDVQSQSKKKDMTKDFTIGATNQELSDQLIK